MATVTTRSKATAKPATGAKKDYRISMHDVGAGLIRLHVLLDETVFGNHNDLVCRTLTEGAREEVSALLDTYYVLAIGEAGGVLAGTRVTADVPNFYAPGHGSLVVKDLR